MRPFTLPLAVVLPLAVTLGACGDRTAVVGDAPDPSVISGVVTGRDGPEAGVWVVAETDELRTGFTKIVVTDDDGRFVLPELPEATYDVWVRGYGLADSEPIQATRGDDLHLVAAYPETPRQAASVYPANYWYSLMEVPPADDFPPTEGSGIAPSMTSQAAWIDDLKQGCQLCHQLGNEATRSIEHLSGRYASTVEAWTHRTAFGQRGTQMNGVLMAMGPAGAEHFADWTDRIMAGEVPRQPPRPAGTERDVVLTMWQWGDATSYVHDEVVTDKRDPSVNANGLAYGVSLADDQLLIVDPKTNEARSVRVPVRDEDTPSYFPTEPGFQPWMYWGDEVVLDAPANVHNPMMDQDGRVWMTSRIRNTPNEPEWCSDSSNPYARYYPLTSSSRQASVYRPGHRGLHARRYLLLDAPSAVRARRGQHALLQRRHPRDRVGEHAPAPGGPAWPRGRADPRPGPWLPGAAGGGGAGMVPDRHRHERRRPHHEAVEHA